MRTLNIGKLNKRLTFKKLVEVEDDLGQITQQLHAICTVWGSLYPVRGIEFYEIQKMQSKVTHKCYVRYREDLDTTCCIEYAGKTYAIEEIIDVDLSHKMLEIMCAEHINREVIENDG